MVKTNGVYVGAGGLTYIRCSGAEYVAFMTDVEIWPDGRFIIQMVNRVDGKWISENKNLDEISATAVVEISDQGGVADDNSFYQRGIIDYFNEWKHSRLNNSAP